MTLYSHPLYSIQPWGRGCGLLELWGSAWDNEIAMHTLEQNCMFTVYPFNLLLPTQLLLPILSEHEHEVEKGISCM